MSRFLTAALCSVALLAGCDSANPFTDPGTDTDTDTDTDTGGGGGGGGTTTPDGSVENVESISYTPGSSTITVTGIPFDGVDPAFPESEYAANATLTALAPGYAVYTNQEDPLDRLYIAVVAESSDGGVQAGVAADGGQFTTFYGGGYYTQIGTYTPGTGQVSYAGNYVGLSNLDADGSELQPPTVPVDPGLLPDQSAQILGEILLNVDFGQNQVEGGIVDLQYVNIDPGYVATYGSADLPDVFLIAADITEGGAFSGSVENPAQEGIGTYSGTFGGDGATSIGGVVVLDGDWDPNVINEKQFGVFVLTQCGQPGDDPICATVNP